MSKNNICQQCHAMLLHPAEYHPYEYCIIAKAFPSDWRKRIKFIIDKGNKFQTHVRNGSKLTDQNE